MKIEICAVCKKLLGEVPDELARGASGETACPVCGAVTRVYEDPENMVRCRVCREIVYPVDFDFLNFGGMCAGCRGN